MKLGLAITGVGMLTPVGHGAAACMHSVRSGITRLALQPYPNRGRQWIAGGSILKWTARGRVGRLAALAEAALRQASQQSSATGAPEGACAVLFGGPEDMRPGYGFPESSSGALSWVEGLRIGSVSEVEWTRAGACSAQLALHRAAQLLASDSVAGCYIVVVDTQLDIRTIRWHEDHHRLKRADISDGLMPAEAACCLFIESEDRASRRGARVIARVLSTAAAQESAGILSDRPNTAAALTSAVTTAMEHAALDAAELGMVWSDLNGESYRAREWAFTEIRAGVRTHTTLMHPADCHGDLGASSDANLLALAAWSLATGWSEGRPLLVFSGSEAGRRAATVLAAGADGHRFLQVSRGEPKAYSTRFKLPAAPAEPTNFADFEDPLRAYFDWQLREEHREMLATLHYQRKALLRDPATSWQRPRRVEERMLQHLDAAVAGGPESMAAVAAGVWSDDEGACFAGALMIGALPHEDNLAWLDAALGHPAVVSLHGIAAGLQHAPDSLSLAGKIDQWLGHPDPAVQGMAASLAGSRRTGDRGRILELLASSRAATVVAAANACWRLHIDAAGSRLEDLLDHPDAEVRAAALVASLASCPSKAAAYCRSQLLQGDPYDAFVPRCLAMAGNTGDVDLLLQQARSGPAAGAIIEALGILGHVVAIPRLIEFLADPDEPTKVAAGQALELMSGHHLREKAIATPGPDPTDQGGEPVEIERVATCAVVWRDWWQRSRARMDPRLRWRRGAPFDAGQCIAELVDEASTLLQRERAHVELASLFWVPVPFEADAFVARQQAAIADMQQWRQDPGRRQERP